MSAESNGATTEIANAQALVARRKAELARNLKDAQRTSSEMAHRLGGELKPWLVAAAGFGALCLVGGIYALSRRLRASRGWVAPRRPSVWGLLARKATGVLLRAGLRALLRPALERARAAAMADAPAPLTTSESMPR